MRGHNNLAGRIRWNVLMEARKKFGPALEPRDEVTRWMQDRCAELLAKADGGSWTPHLPFEDAPVPDQKLAGSGRED